MRVPLSWLRCYVDLPTDSAREAADALLRVGLEVERVESVGADVAGVMVGEVLAIEEFVASNGKTIRSCQVDAGAGARGIVCGARNFVVGDRVPVALPGAVLPGGFTITARKTYGHVSDGMICSARELGIGEDHTGILVLPDAPPLGADVVELLGLRDDVLDIAVTPDRGYCLSVRGLAREAAAAFGVPFRDPALIDVPAADGSAYDVRVEDTQACDRYVARTVTGLDPTALSPMWLQRRLVLAGMRPISFAVDVTNHVLLDLGQPLHAFDRARLAGPIVVRRAGAGEQITTLDGAARLLEPGDLVIADDTGPVALAGVMGGATSEVGPATTDLVIESAHFEPTAVARTSRRLKLASEASRRFERGVDPDLAPAAAQAAVRLLVQLSGATDPGGATDVDRRPGRPPIVLPLALPGRVAGRPYPPEAVRRRLAEVGCAVEGTDPLTVTPPSWRPDLGQAADLVEEVVRLEGYDAIPTVLPLAPAGRGLTREQRLRRQASRALAAAGYVEVLGHPFLSARVWDDLGLPADDPWRHTARLANPLADTEPELRTVLLPGLLATLARNVGRGQPDVALFETGLVYRPRLDAPAAPAEVTTAGRPEPDVLAALAAALPDQPRHAAVVVTGMREPAGWWGPARPALWTDAVEAARVVATAVSAPLTVRAGQRAPWHPGRCAELIVGDRVVGFAGELHPRAIAALGLPPRTAAMELDLGPVLAAAPELVLAAPVSPFPVATQDVALVLDAAVPVAEVAAALDAGAGDLLESLRLFDVYTGDQVPPGHRSLAYSLRFRAPDRTLTVAETTAARDAAVAEAARCTGAVLRAGLSTG